MWILRFTFAFLLLGFTLQENAHYEKVVLTDPTAVCLDGSPGAYYISIGEVP